MTPTLLGRWQTRLLLFLAAALPVSLIYALVRFGSGHADFWMPFKVVAVMLVLGILLDPLYAWFQNFRWDHDWPFVFFLFFTTLEFLAALAISELEPLGLLGFAAFDSPDRFLAFALHFGVVLLLSLLCVAGLLQIFFIRWRFKGGELGRL